MTMYAAIDTEFTRSNEKNMRVLCACIITYDGVHEMNRYKIWTDTPEGRERFHSVMAGIRAANMTLLAYNAVAEVRALLSLGIDPLGFKWLDLHAEMRLHCNHFLRGRYGQQWKKRAHGWELVRGKPYGEVVEPNLVNATLRYANDLRDPAAKKDMIWLILQDKPEYTPEEQTAILEYCFEDITALNKIRVQIGYKLRREIHIKPQQYETEAHTRATWMVYNGLIEHEGIPVDLEAIQTLSGNADEVKEAAIRECVAVFPFFVREHSTMVGMWSDKGREYKKQGKTFDDFVADLKNAQILAGKRWNKGHLNKAILAWNDPLPPAEWAKPARQLEKFIEKEGLADQWPRTKSGYSCSRDTLKEWSHLPAIKALLKANNTLTTIGWYSPDRARGLLSKIGSDERLRPYYNPFGTQSGRNAPPASQFIPAQSSWLRCLIRPPEGYALVAIDYSSQEYLIGAALSGDEAMLRAYENGDVYMGFGYDSGMIPPDGTKHTHPKERQICKMLVLAVGYGAGAESVAATLTKTTGDEWTKDQAKKLLDLHRKTYPKYWAMVDRFARDGAKRPTNLGSGWWMGPHNQNGLSIKNAPIQGCGSHMLRIAVHKAIQRGLTVLYPLHDACYFLCRVSELEGQVPVMKKAMLDAAEQALNGCKLMRIDVEVHHHNEIFVEEKAQAAFEKFGPYAGLKWRKEGEVYYRE